MTAITFFVLFLCVVISIRNVDKIKYTIWRSYFSFMQGEKSANSELFKDFFNEAEMEKNKTDGVLYFIIVPKTTIEKPGALEPGQ